MDCVPVNIHIDSTGKIPGCQSYVTSAIKAAGVASCWERALSDHKLSQSDYITKTVALMRKVIYTASSVDPVRICCKTCCKSVSFARRCRKRKLFIRWYSFDRRPTTTELTFFRLNISVPFMEICTTTGVIL